MQRLAQCRVVAELGIGDDRGHRKATGAHLLQQRQGQAPLFLETDRRRNPSTLALIERQPCLGQIQARADHPRATTGPERRSDGYLTIRRLAQRAAEGLPVS
jgi:hypothetical protein